MQTEEIKRTYTEHMEPRVPLSQNKEFKSVRNAVIQEAMHIVENQHEAHDFIEPVAMKQEKTQAKKESSKRKEKPSGAGGVINLMYHMSRIFQDKLVKGHPLERGVDKKLRRKIEEKKQAQGLRQ